MGLLRDRFLQPVDLQATPLSVGTRVRTRCPSNAALLVTQKERHACGDHMYMCNVPTGRHTRDRGVNTGTHGQIWGRKKVGCVHKQKGNRQTQVLHSSTSLHSGRREKGEINVLTSRSGFGSSARIQLVQLHAIGANHSNTGYSKDQEEYESGQDKEKGS